MQQNGIEALRKHWNALVVIIIFLAHQHKAAGVKIELSKNNEHDGVSHGVKSSNEGDRILLWRVMDSRRNRNTVSLVSYVTAVIRSSADFLDQLYGWL